jgi:hypothetical protein
MSSWERGVVLRSAWRFVAETMVIVACGDAVFNARHMLTDA